MKVPVLLYGRLKSLAPQGRVEISIERNLTPPIFRERVAVALSVCLEELKSCAVANEERVLRESENLGESREFSLLPPVCGG